MFKQLLYSIKRPFHFIKTGLRIGVPAAFKYKNPSRKLKVIVITGTDGKTTTSTLLYHMLKIAGKKVALISTVAAYINNESISTGLHVTSPDPESLNKWMTRMVEENIEYLILEFTSHGAYQYRNWGIKPYITGITNISHEHLDYHLNFDNYIAAKALLFNKAEYGMLNSDDQYYIKLRSIIKNKVQKIDTYSHEWLKHSKLTEAIKEKFPELYNQANAKLAAKICTILEIPRKKQIDAIASFPGVAGRMQSIPNKRQIQVIIDFAHTPNGLESALTALKQQLSVRKKNGRLIAVYGCAGLRDAAKRPIMGKIGTQIADYTVFTAEDPRTENIWSIIRQMKEQLTENHSKIISIIDREEAINYAINKLAKKGDVVGIFGKGPEASMCYGKKEIPWSDLEVARKALESKT